MQCWCWNVAALVLGWSPPIQPGVDTLGFTLRSNQHRFPPSSSSSAAWPWFFGNYGSTSGVPHALVHFHSFYMDHPHVGAGCLRFCFFIYFFPWFSCRSCSRDISPGSSSGETQQQGESRVTLLHQLTRAKNAAFPLACQRIIFF